MIAGRDSREGRELTRTQSDNRVPIHAARQPGRKKDAEKLIIE